MLEMRQAQGLPTPALDNRPTLWEGLEFYWAAFIEIAGTRTSGMTANPISFQEILAWLKLAEVEDAEIRDDVVFFVKRMDMAWMRWARKQSETIKGKK